MFDQVHAIFRQMGVKVIFVKQLGKLAGIITKKSPGSVVQTCLYTWRGSAISAPETDTLLQSAFV